MGFFEGARNVKIVGGEFNDIKGNYTVFDHSRHEINIDSSNTSNNTMTDSYNDNSKRFSGWNPRSRSAHYDREDDEMDWTSSTSAGDRGEEHTGRPPHQPQFHQHPPQFIPRQSSSVGGHVSNHDSFNMKNNQISDSYNDSSQTYYGGHVPPTNQRCHVRPQKMSIHKEGTMPNIEEDEDLQSNSGSFRQGQRPFHPKLPQYTGTGARSDPYVLVDNPHIQQMNQNMRHTFSTAMKHTQSVLAENGLPNTSGEGEGNDESDDASSCNTGMKDPMNAGMANLSIRDSTPLPTSSHPQNATHFSPPPTFSRTKSDPQKPIASQSNRPMHSSNPSPYDNAYYHSYSNPSLAPHMQEQARLNFLGQSASAYQEIFHADNRSHKPSPESTLGLSSPPPPNGGPTFRTIHGDLTKHDTSVHQTNISSFNTENNTIKNSFNDNSLVDSSEKRKKKRGHR